MIFAAFPSTNQINKNNHSKRNLARFPQKINKERSIAEDFDTSLLILCLRLLIKGE